MDNLDLGATIRGFSPGQKVFKRYTLKKILGRGGMGVVWLARDEELEREVALKFLPEVFALDKEAVRDLKRETRRSLELTHPHIVRIYDFVQDARSAAISMEYVPGDTLASRKVDAPEGHFEVEQLKPWVEQLCDALDYAHTKANVVHRDLKPANLMIDARGDLKVADFGIAASVSDSVSRVSAQAGSSGTPVYMSPQQMMGEKPAVTDDIYALGATLYDLLTGKPPFYSGNVVLQVQNKVPPSMNERRAELGLLVAGGADPGIPSEWEETIAACLAKEAKDRPQSAGEVRTRLQSGKTEGLKSAAGRAASPRAPGLDDSVENAGRVSSVHYKTAPDPKTGKAGLWWALGLVALVVAGGGWYLGYYVPAQQRRADALRLAAEQRQEAQAKAKAAQDMRNFEIISERITRFSTQTKASDHADLERAVQMYLTGAPEMQGTAVQRAWQKQNEAWLQARQREERDRFVALHGSLMQKIRELSDYAADATLDELRAELSRKLAGASDLLVDAQTALERRHRQIIDHRDQTLKESLARAAQDEAQKKYQGIVARISDVKPNASDEVFQALDAAVTSYLIGEADMDRRRDVSGRLTELELQRTALADARSSQAKGSGSDLYDYGKLDQAPRLRFSVAPTYPFELQRAGISGSVLVEFIVDTKGEVRNAMVIRSSHEGFNNAAIQAVQQWKFQPGMKERRTVNTRMRVPVEFNLN